MNSSATTAAILISGILVLMSGIIVVIETVVPNPVVGEHTVEKIEFIDKDGFMDDRVVYVETGSEVLAVKAADTLFIKSDGDFALIERKDKSSIRIIAKTPYTIYVPEEQVKELSQNYAKTFGDTLSFRTEE